MSDEPIDKAGESATPAAEATIFVRLPKALLDRVNGDVKCECPLPGWAPQCVACRQRTQDWIDVGESAADPAARVDIRALIAKGAAEAIEKECLDAEEWLAWCEMTGVLPYDVVADDLTPVVALVARTEKNADERWCAAMKRADWDGGVFHHEGRLYPWPTGFVPDCPTTWAQKVAEARADERKKIATSLAALRDRVRASYGVAESTGVDMAIANVLRPADAPSAPVEAAPAREPGSPTDFATWEDRVAGHARLGSALRQRATEATSAEARGAYQWAARFVESIMCVQRKATQAEIEYGKALAARLDAEPAPESQACDCEPWASCEACRAGGARKKPKETCPSAIGNASGKIRAAEGNAPTHRPCNCAGRWVSTPGDFSCSPWWEHAGDCGSRVGRWDP